ncbi:hypothetical protein DMC47_36570 [Nostoc sp. 3335mG]|nr:hypothetical protein DMC47_36570 [Nostoc sp. 3335mG]
MRGWIAKLFEQLPAGLGHALGVKRSDLVERTSGAVGEFGQDCAIAPLGSRVDQIERFESEFISKEPISSYALPELEIGKPGRLDFLFLEQCASQVPDHRMIL